MSDLVKPEIQAKLTAMCREISVARELDAGIQKELYGHMEDKLLAYVNGVEAVTEDDALILVREHFGKPAAVKELLGQVHAWEASVTVARRLAAVFILYFALGAVYGIVRKTLHVFVIISGFSVVTEVTLSLTWAVLSAPLMWLVLRRWQRLIMNGQPLWFLTWSPVRLIGLLVLAHLLCLLGVTVYSGEDGLRDLVSNWASYRSVGTFFTWVSFCAHGCLILWWCDRPPRRSRSLAYAVVAWLVVQLIPNVLMPHPVNVLIVKDSVSFESSWKEVPSRPGTVVYREGPSGFVVPVGHFAASNTIWNVSVALDLVPIILRHGLVAGNLWGLVLKLVLPCILVALVYAGATRWPSRGAPG